MKRVLAIFLTTVITMGAIAFAADNNGNEITEPTATEAPTVIEAPASAPSAEEADITVDPETGEPEVEVKGTILMKDVDYVLSYKDNVNVGTATVIVTFIGNYAGMKEQTFNIVPKPTTKPSSGGGGGGGSRGGGGGSVSLSSITPQPTTEPEYIYHDAYVYGYDTDTGTVFKPDSYITRAEAAAMLSRVLPTAIPTPTATPDPRVRTTPTPTPTVKPTPKTFTDVKKTDWFYDAVSLMSSAGRIEGCDDGTFKPDNRITRAELVTMLIRGSEEKFVGVPFNDVFSNRWYADYIYTAHKLKYIDGYGDNTFRPENPITRAETVKIINGYLSRNDYKNESNPFNDLSDTHWAYKEILEAAVAHKFESEE